MTLFVWLLAACGEDETSKPSAVVDSPNSSVKSEDLQTNYRTGTRSANSSVRSDYAGFGRVGRSHYTDSGYRARWAVIIGLNQFEHMSNLDNAVNDAQALRDMLRDEFGYDEDRIIYLADQKKDAEGNLTNTATIGRKGIMQAFDDLASRDIRSNDAVLVFFAGHGKSDANGAYLAGHDAIPDDLNTWVNTNDLKTRLVAINARHKLVILDSCHAGSILEVDLSDKTEKSISTPSVPPASGQGGAGTRSDGNEAMELRDNLAYYLQEPAFMAIKSGRDQPVGDASKEKPDHSPFTTALLEVLRERANSSRRGDVFTARELAVRVESMVRTNQTPDWGRLGVGRGDFIFKPTRDRLTPREIADRDGYAVSIALADSDLDRGYIARARAVLDACPTNLRHYEWYRLRAAMDTSVATVPVGVSGSCSAFSPDGSRFVAGGTEPSSSGDWESFLKMWDVGNGKLLMDWSSDVEGTAFVAFSFDGKWIVSGGGETIQIRSAEVPGKLLRTLRDKGNSFECVAISPYRERVVTGDSRGFVKVWDPKRHGTDADFPLFSIKGHSSTVTAVAIGVDGKRIVSGGVDKMIRIYDGQSPGKLLTTLSGHGNAITSLAIERHVRRIVSGSLDQTIKIWGMGEKPGEGYLLQTLMGHVGPVNTVAITPDLNRIVSGGWDKTIKVWDGRKGGVALATHIGHRGSINALAIGSDGKQIVSVAQTLKRNEAIKKWDAEKGGAATVKLHGHEKFIFSVAISADGNRVVSGGQDKTIKVWDADRNWVPRSVNADSRLVPTVAISGDGKRIVSGGFDGKVKIWNAENLNEAPLVLLGHDGMVLSVAITPDGNRIVSAGRRKGPDGEPVRTTMVWDANPPGKLVRTLDGHTATIHCVAITPDGKRAVLGAQDGVVKVWNLEDENEAPISLRGHSSIVQSVAITPDGKRIVSGGWDSTIRIWDADSGRPLLTLEGHVQRVYSVKFSSDGKRIVSGSTDGTVQVWDAERGGVPLLKMRGHVGDVKSVDISSDNQRIVSGSFDSTIRLWDSSGWPN